MSTPSRSSLPRHWLVTGGCGFIGSSLVARLRREAPEARIRVLDDLSVGTPGALGLSDGDVRDAPGDWEDAVEIVRGDIRDADACRAAARGADAIVHLAANTGVAPSVADPRTDCITNVVGTLNMLEAARAAGDGIRFVMASSGAPVGEVEPPIHEELAAKPVSPYGASKLAGEGYCSAYARTFGVGTVALRFGNVYGPNSGHKSSAVARFCDAIVRGEGIEIYGAGTQTRDFIYIDDLTDAIMAGTAVDGAAGEIFQIATARETTVNEIVDKLVAMAEARGLAVPPVERAAPRLGDVARNFSDTRKARERLGWQAQTTLDEGLARTLDWFVARGA
ncbi:NAD-dependent epimerase/dehydratase family protein [Jannaschia sp. W003]|uniref:NAD-dependent epimerase/dehydratase family protein n=1 Tax=Jannaschia sp. W003 TaxID=2867012 RepID=UPI0021A74CE4|nr:NAD-dependent epimerase/dehydratase family protein [Jannaschia sp. W003]UWQ22240.1 GDP-mannose 4,6-dehydratase [Jannaschia sp. W003]